jgi:hypothetical protein
VSALPDQPIIHEVNTATWLNDLHISDLRKVPPATWDALAATGADAVWLMGVWQRSARSAEVALRDPSLMRSFRNALDDYTDADVIGSPYSVKSYEVDPAFGGRAGLDEARRQLASRGLCLILDYVPNHVAFDHPWTRANPDCFIRFGSVENVDESRYTVINGQSIALGRDPFFAPWPDVLQLNAFSPSLREATVATLHDIADMCDGVRCDMAMLMTNSVFTRTWGSLAGDVPEDEFWPYVIGKVKADSPNFTFIAEAYWDMEWDLISQGFDYAYDKRLYDRLAHDDAAAVRAHLQADHDYQQHMLRFLENHDEPRAAATFSVDRHRAAAVITALSPGALLLHDGQFEGRRTHTPVFLSRRPEEPVDEGLAGFYNRLARVARSNRPVDNWQLLDANGWPDNDTARNIIAWTATTPLSRRLGITNFAGRRSQCTLRLPWSDLAGCAWALVDDLHDTTFVRDGNQLTTDGLFIDLEPWQSHVFRVEHRVELHVESSVPGDVTGDGSDDS